APRTKRMAEQPPSRPRITGAGAMPRARRRVSWRDIDDLHAKMEDVADRRRCDAAKPALERRRDLGLTEQKQIGIVAGQCIVGRDPATSPGRIGCTMCGVTMMTRSVSFFW